MGFRDHEKRKKLRSVQKAGVGLATARTGRDRESSAHAAL